jgi:hypothetical protein
MYTQSASRIHPRTLGLKQTAFPADLFDSHLMACSHADIVQENSLQNQALASQGRQVFYLIVI